MLLRELSEAFGVSGHEEQVRSLILEQIRGRVDECRIDAMGNLIARKKGTGGSALRIMAAAHMDEVGLMVTQIEDTGLLRFAKVGGIDDRVLPARAVLVGDQQVPGVIGAKPVHLTDKGERERVIELKQLAIDIGASSRAEAEKLVHRGDCAVFMTEFMELPAAGLLAGAAREGPGRPGGVRHADRAPRRALPLRLHGCVHRPGGGGAARRPGGRLRGEPLRRGRPGMHGVQRGAVAEGRQPLHPPRGRARQSRSWTTASSRIPGSWSSSPPPPFAWGFPISSSSPTSAGTDAGAIQRVREGVPSITIAVPARYIHSPAAIMNAGDFESTIALAREALPRLPDALGG